MATDEKNRSPWSEETVDNWESLLGLLHSTLLVPQKEEQGNHWRSPYAYRGMSDSSWMLKTSLERLGSPPAKVEQPILRAFGKYASSGAFSRNSEWERLAVAQHNGLPTRVLDWTASPLIAAHFATVEKEHYGVDGVIWCVNIDRIRDSFIPRTMWERLDEDRAFLFNTPMLDDLVEKLNDFDSMSKDGEDIIAFFEPPSIDSRITNQWGLLSVMNGPAKSHHTFLQEAAKQHPDVVHRIVISASAKKKIRDMLDQNNVTERMLFPGLPGLCKWLERYYGPS